MSITAAGLLLWAFLDRRTIRRWAKSRPPTTWSQLRVQLVRAGTSTETADFVCQALKPYYRYGLTPYSEDQLFSTLNIDPGNVEDTVEQFWKLRGWELPSPSEPKLVPRDPTLEDFALWLEHGGYPPPSK